jgi:hypothetical protein
MGLIAKFHRERDNAEPTGEIHDIDISDYVTHMPPAERAVLVYRAGKRSGRDLDLVAEMNGWYETFGGPGTVHIEADELNAFVKGMPTPKYLVSDCWGHILDSEQGEVMTQWVYDLEEEKVVAANIQHDRALDKWAVATTDELADMEDHLKNANPDALDNPLDWEVDFADEMPEWASVQSTAPKI